MARKPAHIEMAGGKGPRQRVWESIRQHAADFTVREVAMKSGADDATVRTYVQSLERAGVIEVISAPKLIGERKHYRLVCNSGVEAPRVNRQGKPVTASRGNENMWRSMRIMKEFTPQRLAQHASIGETVVSEETARSYVQALARAGYLSVVDAGHSFIPGKGAKQARYMFLPSRNTGPRPPMIQRKRSIYDPNLGKVVWQEAPDHDE